MRVIDKISEEECMSWKQGDCIAITAPTGSGKTHFVLNRLYPMAQQLGRKIVYLCNRILVLEQTKIAAEAAGIEFEDINGCWDSQYLAITTYQKVEKLRRFPSRQDIEGGTSEITSTIFDGAEYCICDEAHYFVHDAVFNTDSRWVLEEMLSTTRKILIFMTATDEPLKLYYSNQSVNRWIDRFHEQLRVVQKCKWEIECIEREWRYDKDCGVWISPDYRGFYDDDTLNRWREKIEQSDIRLISNSLDTIAYPKEWKSYNIGANYSDYQVFYYRSDAELIEEIEHTPDEKWLIFTMDREYGKDFAGRLNKKLGAKQAVFLDSHRTNKAKSRKALESEKLAIQTFNEIKNESRFSCRVLITTTVLDNGVNLHDKQLKNIVLPTHNKTEFIQMIGRKRRAEGDEVKLYIEDTPYRKIVQKQFTMRKRIRYIEKFQLLHDTQSGMLYDADTNSYTTGYQINQPYKIKQQLLSPVDAQLRKLLIHARDDQFNPDKRLPDLRLNPLAVCNLLYDIVNSAKIEELRKSFVQGEPQYEHSTLFEQLRWLGHSYDPTHWVGERIVREKLKEDSDTGYFLAGKDEMQQYVNKLVPLLRPDKKNIGMAAFNNLLKALDIRFRICSKQKMIDHQRQYWYAVQQIKG